MVRALKKRYGTIPWWPGDRDEVMIGAILTQQTRWENVERALADLHRKGLCTMAAIRLADVRDIEDAIRCTGFYRIKAARLKALAAFVEECGGVQQMAGIPTGDTPRGPAGGARDWRGDCRQHSLLRFFPPGFCHRCIYRPDGPVHRRDGAPQGP